MQAPLDGIRVLEVANWLAAPAAAALMADLGADVIKVEPPGGEIYRSFLLRSMGYTYDFPAQLRLPDRQPRQALGRDRARPSGRAGAGAAHVRARATSSSPT